MPPTQRYMISVKMSWTYFVLILPSFHNTEQRLLRGICRSSAGSCFLRERQHCVLVDISHLCPVWGLTEWEVVAKVVFGAAVLRVYFLAQGLCQQLVCHKDSAFSTALVQVLFTNGKAVVFWVFLFFFLQRLIFNTKIKSLIGDQGRGRLIPTSSRSASLRVLGQQSIDILILRESHIQYKHLNYFSTTIFLKTLKGRDDF